MSGDGYTEIKKHEEGWLYRNMEACGGMAIQKYRSMKRDGCTEIWKHGRDGCKEIWKHGRDGCTEIWKHGEGCLYRNIEA